MFFINDNDAVRFLIDYRIIKSHLLCTCSGILYLKFLKYNNKYVYIYICNICNKKEELNGNIYI